jgi:hypothetical protein
MLTVGCAPDEIYAAFTAEFVRVNVYVAFTAVESDSVVTTPASVLLVAAAAVEVCAFAAASPYAPATWSAVAAIDCGAAPLGASVSTGSIMYPAICVAVGSPLVKKPAILLSFG